MFSILDYGAEVTGLKTHHSLVEVQNRAARFYLGVNKFCPLPCLNLEMGWMTSFRRRNMVVLRYYNRIMKMEDQRLPKRVFLNSVNKSGSWANQVGSLMDDLVLNHYWESGSVIPPDILRLMVREKYKEELFRDVDERVKLRTYKTLCIGLIPSVQVKSRLGKNAPSLLTQL